MRTLPARSAQSLAGTAAVAALAAFALTAGAAQAAKLTLKCEGPGVHNKDSAGTVLCGAEPGRGRNIAGVVRNDAGMPVAAKLTVTRSSWTLAPGSGYHVKPTSTKQIVAGADGKFSIRVSPKTRQSLKVDVVPDPALGIAVAASAEAQVSRRLAVNVVWIGGGKVRITVKGTKLRPLKVSVTDTSGYYVPGIPRARKVNRKGQVKFDLGSLLGTFGVFVDAGRYQDLFWYEARRKTFKL